MTSRTSSCLRLESSLPGTHSVELNPGKRLQLNASGHGKPKAFMTGAHALRTFSHRFLHGRTGMLSSDKHAGAKSEHRNRVVSWWHRLWTRGSHAPDCCTVSRALSWPSSVGSRMCAYPIPRHRVMSLGTGLHTERALLNSTDVTKSETTSAVSSSNWTSCVLPALMPCNSAHARKSKNRLSICNLKAFFLSFTDPSFYVSRLGFIPRHNRCFWTNHLN